MRRHAGRIASIDPRVHERYAVLFPRVKGVQIARVAAVRLLVGLVQHLPRKLDVVVGKLANLCVVDTQDFCVLAGAQAQTRDHVDDEQDHRGANERIETTSDGVGQLVGQLDPVEIQPASVDDLHVVEVGDGFAGEEGGADVSNKSTNGVNGEDIERVINSDEELELRSIVGASCSEHSVGYGSPDWNITY